LEAEVQVARTLAAVAAVELCTSTNFLSLLLDSRMQSPLASEVPPFLFRVFPIAMVGMVVHRRLKTLGGPVAAVAAVEIQTSHSEVLNVRRQMRTTILLHVGLAVALPHRFKAGRWRRIGRLCMAVHLVQQ
jgi:hypothetical protein